MRIKLWFWRLLIAGGGLLLLLGNTYWVQSILPAWTEKVPEQLANHLVFTEIDKSPLNTFSYSSIYEDGLWFGTSWDKESALISPPGSVGTCWIILGYFPYIDHDVKTGALYSAFPRQDTSITLDGVSVPILQKDLRKHIPMTSCEEYDTVYFPPQSEWGKYTRYYVQNHGFHMWLSSTQTLDLENITQGTWDAFAQVGCMPREEIVKGDLKLVGKLYFLFLFALYALDYYLLYGLFADIVRGEKRRMLLKVQAGIFRNIIRLRMLIYMGVFYLLFALCEWWIMYNISGFQFWYVAYLVNLIFILLIYAHVYRETKWENQATALDQYQSV